MKRKVLGLMIAVVAALPIFVNAEEVDSTKFDNCVTATGSKTCKLTENINVDEPVEINGDIELDLNGHSITATMNSDKGVLIVHNGATLTINDSVGNGKITAGTTTTYAGVVLTKNGDDDSVPATLIVNNGIIEGYYYGISGNGSRYNTSIEINGGKIQMLTTVGTGIFHPQVGTLEVNGGTITGATGIEMRSGTLEVNGGTIIGTSVPVEVNPNGSGTTSSGAGIAVAQHTTKNAITVVINDGTVQGYSALYESNPQKNSAEDIAKIKITVKGGILETINEGTTVLYSENNLITLEGGEFSGEISEDLIVGEEGTEVYEIITSEGETKYVIATEEDLEEAPYVKKALTDKEQVEKEIAALDDVIKSLEDEIKKIEEAKEEVPESLTKTKEAFYELKELLSTKTVISLNEIVYGNLINNNFVNGSETELNQELVKNVKVTLNLPETLEKLKEGYTRKYSVIRLHINSDSTMEITEIKDVTENEDGTITFETDKFSTYVLAYEDVKAATNPDTLDGISLYMIIASVSLIGLISLIAYAKKARSY